MICKRRLREAEWIQGNPLSYPILSYPVLPSPLTCDFLEWISITEIPTLLKRDARYPVCLAVGRNTIT
jgi:hypothetical protein